MKGEDEAEINRQIGEMLEMPVLASVKTLAEALVAAILSDVPDGAGIDRARLLRMCAATVVLAENEGRRRQGELTEATRRHAEMLRAHVDTLTALVGKQGERIAAQGDLAESLGALVEEQDEIIAGQARVLEAAVEGAAFRELRLPH